MKKVILILTVITMLLLLSSCGEKAETTITCNLCGFENAEDCQYCAGCGAKRYLATYEYIDEEVTTSSIEKTTSNNNQKIETTQKELVTVKPTVINNTEIVTEKSVSIVTQRTTIVAPKVTQVTQKTLETRCNHNRFREADCTTPKTCVKCGEILGSANGHNYISVVTPPTCTKKGYTTYTCSCGDRYISDYVDAKHNVVIDRAVSPTLNSNGLTEGSHCSVCGKVFVEQEVVTIHLAAENSNIDCYYDGGLNGTYKTYATTSNTIYNEYVIESVDIIKENSTNGTFNLTVIMNVRIVNQITGPNAVRGEWLLSNNGHIVGSGVYSKADMLEDELYEITFSKYHLAEGDYKLTFSSAVS